MAAGASVAGDAAVPSDAQLLEELDLQALWKDVQRHAGHGALPPALTETPCHTLSPVTPTDLDSLVATFRMLHIR